MINLVFHTFRINSNISNVKIIKKCLFISVYATSETLSILEINGDPLGIRTLDPLIKSQ